MESIAFFWNGAREEKNLFFKWKHLQLEYVGKYDCNQKEELHETDIQNKSKPNHNKFVTGKTPGEEKLWNMLKIRLYNMILRTLVHCRVK